jgi:tetratricopeptide (TPR) repeat protein
MFQKSRSDLLLRLLFILTLAFCVSCQRTQEKQADLFQSDARAKAELTRINGTLQTGRPLSPQDFEALKRIREKHADSDDVRKVFQSALIRREDWESLANLISEIPSEKRNRDDHLNLARSYVKLGRFSETIDLMKPLAETNPADLEYNSLLAMGYFYLGDNDDAGKSLDRVWDPIIQNKRVDEIQIRGMVYLRKKDYENAIQTLEKALQINPEFIPALNALSLAYAAKGDAEHAETYRRKTETAQDLRSTNEIKARRAVKNSYLLEDAWGAKRYEEVIGLARTMLPEAADDQKTILYQYLAESYKALGKHEEAAKVLTEAQRVKQ